MTTTSSSRRRGCALALLAAALPGCYVEGTGCTPTRTAATAADKVDLRAALRSATVEARLTAGGEALSGHTLTFEILDDGATVYDARATTGANGRARVDLKRADPEALVALARADQFRATFTASDGYCGSSDQAAFRTVRT